MNKFYSYLWALIYHQVKKKDEKTNKYKAT